MANSLSARDRRQGVVPGGTHTIVRRQATQRHNPPPRRPGPGLRANLGRALAVLLFVGLLLGTAGFVAGALAPSKPTPSPRGPIADASPTRPIGATASGLAIGPSASGSPAALGPTDSARPGSAPPSGHSRTSMPIVPVVAFWSTETEIGRDELKAAVEGSSTKYRKVIVPTEDRDAIAATLGATPASSLTTGNADQIRNAVRDGALGLMRAVDVTPAVRALALDGAALFGNKRVTDANAWPLRIDMTESPDRVWDQGATWTLVGGGDILLDRGPAHQMRILNKGVDFPWSGGTIEITGFRCCSGLGHPVPAWRRTGNEGIVRDLYSRADVSTANLESPVDNQWRYHDSGLVFTGEPRLLDGLKNVGIDYTSLANNHIGNAGPDGVLETIDALDERGIAHSGAGENVTAARQPAIVDVKGLKVAVISCDAIARVYWAGDSKVGSNGCRSDTVSADIRAVRPQADIVVIYPHWGIEYTPGPTAAQRKLAADWIAAGADLIFGNHPHWAQAFEEIDGHLVFYALGNLVFDQEWQENTMEGLIVELTFQGKTLRQVTLHPTLVVEQSQPNLLDPAGDGQRVLSRIRDASKRIGLGY